MERTRARDLGIVIGTFRTGTGNAITDVAGVRVGHSTLVSDDPVVARTGVTVVWPHAGTPWRDRVYVGTSILNGYGELIGINQLNEWGLLHTPVVLASSLAIGFAYDANARWIAERDSAQGVDDVFMPLVTECDDSFLNDARAFPLQKEHVVSALEDVTDGPILEGCVGPDARDPRQTRPAAAWAGGPLTRRPAGLRTAPGTPGAPSRSPSR